MKRLIFILCVFALTTELSAQDKDTVIVRSVSIQRSAATEAIIEYNFICNVHRFGTAKEFIVNLPAADSSLTPSARLLKAMDLLKIQVGTFTEYMRKVERIMRLHQVQTLNDTLIIDKQ